MSDLEAKYEAIISETSEKYGLNEMKFRAFAEQCALKAMPYFRTFGVDYGDRIPSLYRIADIIAAELLSELFERNTGWLSTGALTVEKREWEEEPAEIKVYLDLGTTELDELK